MSGARGGESLGLDRLAGLGVVLTGRLEGFAGRHALFAPDLGAHVCDADRRLYRALAKIDGAGVARAVRADSATCRRPRAAAA